MSQPRRYRFSPLDTTGWLYGLNAQQCVLLTIGVVGSGILLDAHAYAVITATPILLTLVLAFLRVGSTSIVDRMILEFGIAFHRLRRQQTWSASLKEPVPKFLGHLEFIDTTNSNVGAVVDHAAGTIGCTFRASTKGFVLEEDDSQNAALELWGDVLASYSATNSPVRRISICESTTESEGTAHVTYITLTTTISHLRIKTPSPNHSKLLDQLDAFSNHLRNNGLNVSSPLTRQQLFAAAIGHASPANTHHVFTLANITQIHRSLARSELSRHSLQMDNTHHRSYWVRQWPATGVAPNWLEPLLMHEGLARSITVHFEPVPRAASVRAANKTATKLETDVLQRERSGFRIDETHRRTQRAASDRETELGAGYTEFQYVGIITISETSVGALQQSSVQLEQIASMCGMELMSLDGHHDLGLLYSLPLGQSPDRKRFST